MGTKQRHRFSGQRWFKGAKILVSLLFFASVGALVLHMSRAAVPAVGMEVESGVPTMQVQDISDATASGGHAVRFASGTDGADPCRSMPAQPSAKPTASNSGVPAGTTLTASGDITASTAGMMIDAKNIMGSVYVTANNVTIKNSKINMQGYWGIRIDDGVTGTKVLHNEIYSASGGYTGVGTGDGGANICGNYIHHFENAITVVGPSIVQANFIEKLLSDSPGAHYDGIELYAGSNSTVIGNNFMLTDGAGNWRDETGAINVTATWGDMDDIQLKGNWVGGGSYTVYVDEQGYDVTNAVIQNNVWYGNPPSGHALFGPIMIRDNSSVLNATGNTWEGGSVLSL